MWAASWTMGMWCMMESSIADGTRDTNVVFTTSRRTTLRAFLKPGFRENLRMTTIVRRQVLIYLIFKEFLFSKLMKVPTTLLSLFLIHCIRYTADYLHWRYCASSFIGSILTSGSPLCKGLKSTSDSAYVTIVDVIKTGLELLSSSTKIWELALFRIQHLSDENTQPPLLARCQSLVSSGSGYTLWVYLLLLWEWDLWPVHVSGNTPYTLVLLYRYEPCISSYYSPYQEAFFAPMCISS